MSRGIGEFGPLQDLIPEWLAVVVALLTQLGDIWFLTLVLGGLYWFDTARRDGVAVVAGLWLVGIGLYQGLKEFFALPRPDEPLLDPELLPVAIRQLYEATALATGYGFPSGHAVNTTIVYFGLASVLTVSTARRRYAGAAGLVTIVSVSRVALGVHYLVDVVAGVGVGFLLLLTAGAITRRGIGDRPTVSFGLAVVFAGFFLAISDVARDAVLVLGASLGAFAGWQLVVLGGALVDRSRPFRPLAVRGGLAAAALALLAAAALVPVAAALAVVPLRPAYVTGSAVGFATAAVVVAPVLRRSERDRRAGVRSLLSPDTWKRGIDRARAWIRAQREQ